MNTRYVLREAPNTDGRVVIQAVVDPLEPPMPAEISLDEAAKFAKSLCCGLAGAGRGPEVHAHAVLGKVDGNAIGGHIKEAIVWLTVKLLLEEYPDYLQKRSDPETGLTLIDLDAARTE